MDNATKKAKKNLDGVGSRMKGIHPQVPATPNSFPTLEPAVSEHGGVLMPNIPIMCDDVVRRNDVGVQTISDWCNTESIPSGVDVSIQTESHCVCRCDSHGVHHVSNTVM